MSSIANSTASPASTASANSSTSSSSSAAATSTNLANEQTFLKLLVAQMKNQNPLNPVDSTQFITQLAQFSSLEQLTGIKQDADNLVSASSSKTTATATSTASTPAATNGTGANGVQS